jgi:peptidoglycan/LPS O-acetylase OafA/YrhL
MTRLRSLDGLRGIAALTVVVWHWYYFYPDDAAQHGWTPDRAPFFWLLRPFYVQGWTAVDLFFTLSGFVFFWLYGEAIRSRAVGGWRFGLLRVARLYPLQFLTLLIVCALQWLFIRSQGHSFIFDNNDAPHFVAQIFMVQNWWPRAASSFNGVNWSVSIEVMLYVVFFIACRAGLKQGLHCLGIALLGGLLLPHEEHIARGVIGFFMGGFVFSVWTVWQHDPRAARLARILCGAALAGWAFLWFLTFADTKWFASGEANDVFILSFDLLLSPLTVLALAMREKVRGPSHTLFGFLGDISYAVYLLQFPMLLSLKLLAIHMGWDTAFLMQGWVMIVFFASLIGVSALVHYRFERPMQLVIREGLSRGQPFPVT